ncbi:HNH endonuclease signature motif containing protein [Microbacterium xanthum]|uniref:HNH endonuclease signature motif containing protein n=1 Tax=Microbacterium xanthum TaxID=3079794 RepID=UPI002AD399A5|nr:DUF222 domain-containing protein [Microbacterium sp. KSW-48]MDZ8171632.1 DUF222 domain-containing protein [Microbacterium sp. KSW-48]
MDDEWQEQPEDIGMPPHIEIPISVHIEAAAAQPDSLDDVLDFTHVMMQFAAQRYAALDRLRERAIREAQSVATDLGSVALRSLRLEVAAAMRVSEYVAETLLHQAEALVQRYPAVWHSLHAGRIDDDKGYVLVAGLDELGDDATALLPEALHAAETLQIGPFRRALRRLIEQHRVNTLEERHEEAVARRRVVLETGRDGMAWIGAHLPAVEAHAIHQRITAMGKAITAVDGEERTLDQARADVFGDLLVDGTTVHLPEHARGIRATVVVTVPALSLLSGTHPVGAEPASVEGIGPIPHSTARTLCGGSGEWMRVLTHPETGAVLSVGRDRYRPPKALRDVVRWRAGRCMAPGCGMPAERCEIDHSIAWEDGGRTELRNLHPLCKGHHTVKHHGGWSIRHQDDGDVLWISPTGRRYVVAPERRVPAFRPDPEPRVPVDAPF